VGLTEGAMAEDAPKSDNAAPTLYGTWELKSVDCVDHKLGKQASLNRTGLSTLTMGESLRISHETTESHFIERKWPVKVESYCETVTRSKWTLKSDTVQVTEVTFVSRQGFGGYQCYEPYYPRTQKQRDYALKYKVDGNKLLLSSPDIKIHKADKSIERFCETGADFVQIYERKAQ
jgi:hypothetical protein